MFFCQLRVVTNSMNESRTIGGLNIYFTLEFNAEMLYLHTLRSKAFEKISFNVGGLGRKATKYQIMGRGSVLHNITTLMII